MQIIIDGKVVKVPSGGGTDFTVDPTLTMSDENVLSVTTPVHYATYEEYDNMSTEEKRGLWIVTDEKDHMSGSNGTTPIGTIISFMGTTAPDDYLICDGSIYNISDFKQLANFFKKQFGTVNHFGGDGTTTFAVPDLRNLFLRGYHGELGEQLSGEIGEKQEATSHPYVYTGSGSSNYITSPTIDGTGNRPTNVDGLSNKSQNKIWDNSNLGSNTNPCFYKETDTNEYIHYSARPVNTAVLFCIKAQLSVVGSASSGASEVYSEEETVIGTWFGKPLYRKCYRPIEIPALSSAMWIAIGAAPVEANAIRKVEGSVISADGTETYMFSINPATQPQTRIRLLDDALTIQFYANSTFYGSDNEENYLAIEYTKSTD